MGVDRSSCSGLPDSWSFSNYAFCPNALKPSLTEAGQDYLRFDALFVLVEWNLWPWRQFIRVIFDRLPPLTVHSLTDRANIPCYALPYKIIGRARKLHDLWRVSVKKLWMLWRIWNIQKKAKRWRNIFQGWMKFLVECVNEWEGFEIGWKMRWNVKIVKIPHSFQWDWNGAKVEFSLKVLVKRTWKVIAQ